MTSDIPQAGLWRTRKRCRYAGTIATPRTRSQASLDNARSCGSMKGQAYQATSVPGRRAFRMPRCLSYPILSDCPRSGMEFTAYPSTKVIGTCALRQYRQCCTKRVRSACRLIPMQVSSPDECELRATFPLPSEPRRPAGSLPRPLHSWVSSAKALSRYQVLIRGVFCPMEYNVLEYPVPYHHHVGYPE
jgi:hypothetical protein